MKITLIHPSRGRALKAAETLNHWIMRASGAIEIEHILSLDADDPEYNIYINQFPKFTKFCLNEIPDSNVVFATNHAAKHATGDILIYLSDDFGCPFHWDKILAKRILTYSKAEWLLKVDDCLQPFQVAVLTIPIMSKPLYDKLGYFWFPEYRSMFVDEDLYWTCMKLECILMAPEIKFPHNHPSNGKAENDETYIRSANNWNQGKELFARRKAAGFPLLNETTGKPIEVLEINNHQTDFYKSNI